MRKYGCIAVILLALWALLFFLFATQVNIKGIRGNPDSDGTYEFEYKYGFPTPWYSRYYSISDEKEVEHYKITSAYDCRLFDYSCSKVKTPDKSKLFAKDVALNILSVQAFLAFVAALLITGLGYGGTVFYKHAHNRH